MEKAIINFRRIFANVFEQHQKIKVRLVAPTIKRGEPSICESLLMLSSSEIERYIRKGYGLNYLKVRALTPSFTSNWQPIVDERHPISLFHPCIESLFTSGSIKSDI